MLIKFFPYVSIFLFLSFLSSLTWSDNDIDELVVIGSRLDLRAQDLGSAMTILTADDIADMASPFLADVLRHVPGLAVSRTGPAGGLTQVRVRGSEANHVLVFIDGIEANTPNGEFDFSTLTTSQIERIEILRGPQSGLYGSNATAGVINIVTRQAQVGQQIDMQLESGSLDFNRQALSWRGGSDALSASVNLNHQRFAFNAAERGNETDLSESYAAFTKLNWTIRDHVKIFAVGTYTNRSTDTDDQLAGLAVDSSGIGENKQTAYQFGIESQNVGQALRNKIWFDRSEFVNAGRDGFGNFGDRARREKIALQTVGQWASQHAIAQRATLFAESEQQFYRNTTPFDPSQIPEQSRRLQSVGIEYFASLQESISVNAAIRADDNDDFANATTYQLGGRWFWRENSSLRASIGTGITNPSFFEQFGFIPGFFTGNPDLEPERQKSWDLGWQQSWLQEQLSTGITFYKATLTKEITGFATPINLSSDSDRKGIELSIEWHSSNGVEVTGAYTYTKTSEAKQPELRRPKNSGSVDVSLPLLANKLKMQVGLLYNGTILDTDFSDFSRQSLDAYTVVNALLRYTINNQASLFMRLNNVLDEEYQEVIGYATPGFYASAGVAISL